MAYSVRRRKEEESMSIAHSLLHAHCLACSRFSSIDVFCKIRKIFHNPSKSLMHVNCRPFSAPPKRSLLELDRRYRSQLERDFTPSDVEKIAVMARHIQSVQEGSTPFDAYFVEFHAARSFFENAGTKFCRAAESQISAHLIPVLFDVLSNPSSKELFSVCLNVACDLCAFAGCPTWAELFVPLSDQLFQYFTDPSSSLFDALTAFIHQLLVNVASYRAYFIRSGLLFDFI
jgi:hypothetical protein